jgi:FAD:protein FMN transferase
MLQPKPLKPRLITALVVLLAALSVHRLACSSEKLGADVQALHLSGPTMGTTYSIKVVTKGPVDAPMRDKLSAIVSKRLQEVDESMSTYRPDSELMRFNNSTSTEPIIASHGLLAVLDKSVWLSGVSGGAFDVTVGPLINAWGFGAEGKKPAPSDNEIKQLKEQVGYWQVVVDTHASTLRKRRGDIFCDLSAIAPGYAADIITQDIEALGIENYMVDIGGEMRVRGHNEHGSRWRIAVQKPDSAVGATQDVLELQNDAVATSGDYRNFTVTEEGKRIAHTIDPRSGQPANNGVASVTVLHPNSAALADGFATAFMVLPPEESERIARDHGLGLMLILRGAKGELTVRSNEAFEQKRVKHAAQ